MNLLFEMLKEVDDNVLCECASALASLKRHSVQGPSVKIEVHMQVSLEKRLEMLKEKAATSEKKDFARLHRMHFASETLRFLEQPVHASFYLSESG